MQKRIISILLTTFFLMENLMADNIEYKNINGIKVPFILEYLNISPTIQLDIIFKHSGTISNDKTPISKFTSKILNEGSSKKPFDAFHQELEQRAISLSVNTGRETMAFSISCLKEELPYAMKLLKELFRYPNISKKSFQKVSLMMKSSILEQQVDFDSLASNQLHSMIFKDTVFEQPSIGTLESLKQIKIKTIKEFFKNHITTNNAVVVVGGDFNKNDIKSIQNSLSVLPNKKSKEIQKITPNLEKRYKKIQKDTKQAYIYFASPFNMNINDEDIYKAKVAFFILGSSGFGSRLMNEIRVKKALAYSAYAYTDITKSYSIMTGYMQTKTNNEKQAIEIIKKEIDKFLSKGATQKELDSAKKFILGSEPLRNETISQRLNQRFNEYYKNLGENSQKRFLDKISKLTLKDLNIFIKKHTEISNIAFSVVTNK